MSFDPDALRLAPSWSSGITVKRVLTTIPVKKPDKKEFFRIRPGDDWVFDALVYVDSDDSRYLIAPVYQGELFQQGLARPVRLFTGIGYTSGVLFLTDVALPDIEGKIHSANQSRMQHYETAKTRWIRISYNQGLGAYDLWLAEGTLADPEWPEEPANMAEALKLAFKDHYIDNENHPVLNKLRGRA
ncbi:MAG: hypothetical protein Q7J09_10475 [Methanocalculus sp.]|uniref:hypothetical protein n=1 Tax=Methanocalculus sp. TaxID=2004547 RepID=UPI00271CABC5|nr:hypothetical protein [Methanocalculus sp.]MDO9540409.1 hypothetical protein [Methanocalculus sp.]